MVDDTSELVDNQDYYAILGVSRTVRSFVIHNTSWEIWTVTFSISSLFALFARLADIFDFLFIA